jgi:hypothetical protein
MEVTIKMADKQNYGFVVPMFVFVAGVIAIFLPMLLFGLGGVYAFYRIIFSPIMSGSISVWVILGIGILAIFLFRRKSSYL